MQRTLVIIKPDGIERSLIGEITKRFEQKGLKLVGAKMQQLTKDLLEEHYFHHKDAAFFPELAEFMQRSPVLLQCWEGKEAVQIVRNLCGVTNAREASAGTIRGDFAVSQQRNIVHASGSEEEAQEEIARFFHISEIFEYDKNEDLMYSKPERG